MRSRTKDLLAAAAALLAVALPAAAFALPGAAPAKPLAVVRVTECTRGETQASRRAEFRGAMRRIPATVRMRMRFSLQERVGGGDFARVEAPGLGMWRRSRPGVARFAYRQRVLALAEGSAYRVVVQYRWIDADGNVVRRALRRSRACRQPGRLPNLRVRRIDARPVRDRPDVFRYAVLVVNRGRAPAAGVTVSVAVDGGMVDTGVVGTLRPGAARWAVVRGPECAYSVEARVDPEDTVRESSETDNARAVSCPAGQ